MTEITRLFDFPYYQHETYNLEKAFTTKYDGKWKSTSTKEYIDLANTISRGLLKLGVQPTEQNGILSTSEFYRLALKTYLSIQPFVKKTMNIY